MDNTRQWLAAGLVLLAPACATLDTPTPALNQARSTVRTAETDPNVVGGAPVELRRAADSLARANRAAADGEPAFRVDHYAYVATRQAQTAIAIGATKYNEAAIRSGEVDRERARADVRALEAQNARAEASAQRAQTSVALQQATAAQLQAEDARVQAQLAQQRAREAQQQTVALQTVLAELEAQGTDRGRVVTLGDVLFEFNRAEVRSVAQSRLAKLATFLNEFPDRQVLIEGYTDNVGSVPYNEQLSARRAEAIRNQLATLGVDSRRMSAVGYGMDYPVAANNTDTNRALNRRVEVIISDDNRPVRARR